VPIVGGTLTSTTLSGPTTTLSMSATLSVSQTLSFSILPFYQHSACIVTPDPSLNLTDLENFLTSSLHLTDLDTLSIFNMVPLFFLTKTEHSETVA